MSDKQPVSFSGDDIEETIKISAVQKKAEGGRPPGPPPLPTPLPPLRDVLAEGGRPQEPLGDVLAEGRRPQEPLRDVLAEGGRPPGPPPLPTPPPPLRDVLAEGGRPQEPLGDVLAVPKNSRQLRYTLFALIILLPLVAIGGSTLAYAQLNRPQNNLYQVDARSGSIQWQHSITSPTQTAMVDAQGSLLNISVDHNLHQLVALDHHGVLRWKTFTSPEDFSLPVTSSQPDTVLVALSGAAPMNNADNTSLSPFQLYLFKRSTGQTIWQKTIIAAILGADTTYLYVALIQTYTPLPRHQPAVQLIAIEQATGKIVWRIGGPAPSKNMPYEGGKLLVQEHHIIWQVAGTVYAIDPATGTTSWHQLLQEANAQTLMQEESKMVEIAGFLVVVRSDGLHALDLASGTEQWMMAHADVNPDIEQSIGGIVATSNTGNALLMYGNGQIEAINVLNQAILWSQKQLQAIQSVTLSGDGKLAYITATDSIEDSAPAQILAALDMSNGAVRWSFQPSEQTTFLPPGVEYSHGILLTMTCQPVHGRNCSDLLLYALNATTGDILWKYEGNTLSDVYLSTDGSTVVFQSTNSAWSDLIHRFRN